MVKVVILCGGKGTRIREETEFKPKPLVEIGGLPVIWHIMKHYDTDGYNEFVLCLGYKGRMIKEFFMEYEWDSFDFTMKLTSPTHVYHKTHEAEDWTITFADTGMSTKTGGRVKAIEKYIPEEDEYFLLTYGDGLCDVDINDVVEFHKKSGKLITITGVHPIARFGMMETNDEGVVTAFAEKPELEEFIHGGYMVVSRKVLAMMKDDIGAFEEDILPKLSSEGQVAMYKHRGFWHCMDTHKDYLDLNRLWHNSAPWKKWKNHPKK